MLFAASNNSPADAKRMTHHGHKERDQRERDHRSEVSIVTLIIYVIDVVFLDLCVMPN